MTRDELTCQVITGVEALLELLGTHADAGTADTPARFLRAMQEMAGGLADGANPADVLDTVFESDHDELVLVRDVPFVSVCEHHLLPFTGTATIGYLPSHGRIVGLSKLARLLDGYARRPQVQERLTQQVAGALVERLRPLAAGVVIRSEHGCMTCRGVRKPGATMVTSCLHGVWRTDAAARAEFLSLGGARG